MSIGKELKGFRERNNLSQKTVASDLYIDQTLVSKVERGERNASEEFLKNSVEAYSDAQYGFAVAHETARGYIPPLATANKGIEWHRLALEEVAITQMNEAIKHFERVSLVKHPEFVTEDEVQEISIGIKELLDVQTTINSFLARLEQVYPVSVKACMRKRLPEWKSKGWIK